jgi:hypothetical protein
VIKIITRQSMANETANKWATQYPSNYPDRGGRFSAILDKLRALGPSPKPDDVDKEIGNKSWTTVPVCDCCLMGGLSSVAMMGEEPDYESSTAYVCIGCARHAVRELERVEKEEAGK